MIDFEKLRQAQVEHEIRMERDVQLSLLTADQIAGRLVESVSLDRRVGQTAPEPFHHQGESPGHPETE